MTDKPRPIKQILVTTDLSMESVGGVLLAKNLAAKLGAEVHALHVITPVGHHAEKAMPGLAKAHDDMAMEELGKFTGSHGLGADTKLDVSRGNPADEVLKHRYQIGADLLVLGRYGKGGLKRGSIGSVASRLVRKVPVSVLIAQPQFRGDLKRIGVATGFEKDADQAVIRAAQLASTFGAGEILILHAYMVPPGFEWYCSWEEAKAKLEAVAQANAQEMLDRVRPQLPAGVNIRTLITEGPTEKVVPRMAEEEGLDLLVLSTHGRSGTALALLGHTTETIINNAPCSVWTETSPSKVQGFVQALGKIFG